MPKLCSPVLEFPERQKAGKALKITLVRESEKFRRLLKVTQQTMHRWGLGLGFPEGQTRALSMPTLPSRITDRGTDLP